MADPFSIATWRNVFVRHGQKFGWGLAIVLGLPMVIGFGLSQYTGRGQQANIAASRNAILATVNGIPVTEGRFTSELQRAPDKQPGEQYASTQGQILQSLIAEAVLQQEAKRRGATVSDAEIDRQIATERERVLGKNASDSDWEDYVTRATGMSASEYRDTLAQDPRMLAQALIANIKQGIKVTEQDAKNQSAEVRLTLVLIPAGKPTPFSPGVKPLPDADAQKKAEDLLAKAKAGGDLAAIAKANSSDPSAKKGGDTDWKHEYQMMSPTFGALGYGKDFDAAVQKTPTGQFTDVIKVAGFGQGYAFAKVMDRRNNLPKTFDVKQEMEKLKDQQATLQFSDLLQKGVKTAKVEFNDADKKAFYDRTKLEQMQQEQMMAQFGQGNAADAPTAADVQKQQAMVDSEFEALLKRHPDDPTAALLVASSLKAKRFARDTTPAQRDQIRDRLIQLYESALKTTEDRNIRFELADLYHEKKDDAKAGREYQMIARLLNADPPYNLQTMQAAMMTHNRLVTAFRSVNLPEDAAKEQTKADEVRKQLAEEQKKEAAAAKAQPSTNLTLPAGPGSTTRTLTIPANAARPEAGKPEAAPSPTAPETEGKTGTANPAGSGANAAAPAGAPNKNGAAGVKESGAK
jgi:parvulin-like peptidyl-prolyl isomerase